MPRIREYTNTQGLDAGPIASAAQGAATAGFYQGQNIERAFNALGQGIEEVGQHIAQNETSKLAADFATTQAELTQQWDEISKAADPNDHEVANRFMNDVVRPRLEKLGDGLITQPAQNLYQKAAAGLHADLFNKTTSDQSQLAGVAAVMNLNTIRNNFSQSLRNDPTSFDSVVALSNAAIVGYVETQHLPRDKALELQQSLNKNYAEAAFLGMAEKNPAAAKQALADGKFADYFDTKEVKALDDYADTQAKAAETAAKAAETEQRRQQKEEFGAAQTKILASVIDPQTGEVHVTPDALKAAATALTMPGAAQDPGGARALLSSLRTMAHDEAAGKPAVTDPHLYSDFQNRAFLPDGDPRQLTTREIDEARVNHQLSDHDYTVLRGAVTHAAANPQLREQRRKDHITVLGFQRYITGDGMLPPTPQQWQRWSDFQRDAGEKMDNMHNQGKTDQEIEEAVRHMVPRYQIGTKAGLKLMQDNMTDVPHTLPPVNANAPKHNEGETPEQYLKRIGG